MRIPLSVLFAVTVGFLFNSCCDAQTNPSTQQLENWLRRFPNADANRDGKLSIEEANAFRKKLQTGRTKAQGSAGKPQGAPREFKVDPGWDLDHFPGHAVCYKSADEIKAIFENAVSGKQAAVVSFAKPETLFKLKSQGTTTRP